MGLDSYNGSINLISGIKQANNGSFPLVEANAVQVDENDTRLDTKLASIEADIFNKEDRTSLNSTNCYYLKLAKWDYLPFTDNYWGQTLEEKARNIAKFDVQCTGYITTNELPIIQRARELNPNLKILYYISVASARYQFGDGSSEDNWYTFRPGGVWDEEWEAEIEEANPNKGSLIRIKNKWEILQEIEAANHALGTQTNEQIFIETYTWTDINGVQHSEDKYIYKYTGGYSYDGFFWDDVGWDNKTIPITSDFAESENATDVINSINRQGFSSLADKYNCINQFAHDRGMCVCPNHIDVVAQEMYDTTTQTSSLNSGDFVFVESSITYGDESNPTSNLKWSAEDSLMKSINYLQNYYDKVQAKVICEDYMAAGISEEIRRNLITALISMYTAIGVHYFALSDYAVTQNASIRSSNDIYIPDILHLPVPTNHSYRLTNLTYTARDTSSSGENRNKGFYNYNFAGNTLSVSRNYIITSGNVTNDTILYGINVYLNNQRIYDAFSPTGAVKAELTENIDSIQEVVDGLANNTKQNSSPYNRLTIDDWSSSQLDYTDLIKNDTFQEWAISTSEAREDDYTTVYNVNDKKISWTQNEDSSAIQYDTEYLSIPISSEYFDHRLQLGYKATATAINASASWFDFYLDGNFYFEEMNKYNTSSQESSMYPDKTGMYVKEFSLSSADYVGKESVEFRMVFKWNTISQASLEALYLIDLDEFEEDTVKTSYTNLLMSPGDWTTGYFTPKDSGIINLTTLSTQKFSVEMNNSSDVIDPNTGTNYTYVDYNGPYWSDTGITLEAGHTYEIGFLSFTVTNAVLNFWFKYTITGSPELSIHFSSDDNKTESSILGKKTLHKTITIPENSVVASNSIITFIQYHLLTGATPGNFTVEWYLYDTAEDGVIIRGYNPATTSLRLCRVTDETFATDKTNNDLLRNTIYFSDSGKTYITDINSKEMLISPQITYTNSANLFNKNTATEDYTINSSGVISASSGSYVSDYISVEYLGQYYLPSSYSSDIVLYNADKEYISGASKDSQGYYIINRGSAKYIRFTGDTESIDTDMFCKDSYPSSYVAYKTNIITDENLEYLASNKTSIQALLNGSGDSSVNPDLAALVAMKSNLTTLSDNTNNITSLVSMKSNLTELSNNKADILALVDEKEDIEELIENGVTAANKWSGKKCLQLGDSITWYDGHTQGDTTIKGYAGYLRDIGMTVINKGVSGACIAYTGTTDMVDICTMIDNVTNSQSNDYVDLSTCDLITIAGGVNDYQTTPRDIGDFANSNFDTTKFIQAYQYIINKIQTINPSIIIVLFSPLKCFNTDAQNSYGFVLEDYADAVNRVAAYYDLPLFDQYNLIDLNLSNQATYLYDGLHPNNTGYQMICNNFLIPFLDTIGSYFWIDIEKNANNINTLNNNISTLNNNINTLNLAVFTDNGTENLLDLSLYPIINYNCVNYSYWVANSIYPSLLIPVTALSKQIKFKNTTTVSTQGFSQSITYVFLKSNTNITANAAIDYCSGTTKYTLAISSEVTLTIPDDCNYLCVFYGNASKSAVDALDFEIYNQAVTNRVKNIEKKLKYIPVSSYAYLTDVKQMLLTMKHHSADTITGYTSTTHDNCLLLAHISDVHTDQVAYKKFMKFVNTYNAVCPGTSTSTLVDLSSISTINFNLESPTHWTANSAYKSMLIPVSILSDTITLKARSTKYLKYAFLTSNENIADDASVAYCTDDTIYRVEASATATINIPSDCNYLYLYLSNVAIGDTTINKVLDDSDDSSSSDSDENIVNENVIINAGIVTGDLGDAGLSHVQTMINIESTSGYTLSKKNDYTSASTSTTHNLTHTSTGQAIYQCMGNHESIYAYDSGAYTYDGVYDAWDMNTGGLYYSVDFDTERVKMIVLNQYEYNTTTYVNDRNLPGVYSRAQISWFISQLTEAQTNDYGVIIAYHSAWEHGFPEYNESGFCQNISFTYDGGRTSDTIIADIVNAFQTKTSLTKTYTISSTRQIGDDESASPTVTYDSIILGDPDTTTDAILCDFSSGTSNGIFVCYLSGHTHVDYIGYSKKYPNQLICVIQAAVVNNPNKPNANYSSHYDTPRIPGTSTRDSINVYGVDMDSRILKVMKYGSTLTDKLIPRTFAMFEF